MTDQPAEQPPRRVPHGWLRTGLVAVVALTVGVSIGLLAPVLARPDDDSAEAGFARDMQTHHAQAVEMSMIAYQRGADPEIRTIGVDIALAQQGQIGIMHDWLDQWHLSPTASRPAMAWMPGHTLTADGLMPGMATKADIDRLRTATGPAFDILYSQLMIRHHLGGIMMIDQILHRTDRDNVRTLASSMKTGQQNEIAAFTAILARNNAKPL